MIPQRISRTSIWFEIGDKVVHKPRPKFVGTVEAIWTDHKLAQEFAQVLWEDGSRDVVPAEQLQKYEEYQEQIWRPEYGAARKELRIAKRLDKSEIDAIKLRAILEAQGFTDEEIREKIRVLTKASIYETVEGWKVFEAEGKRFILKGGRLLEE